MDNMVLALTLMRECLEEDTNTPIHRLQVPALLLLNRVCIALGYGADDRRAILGDDGCKALAQREYEPYWRAL